jgi:hypothetical protein
MVSLEDKMNFAQEKARIEVAERHFYEAAQPFFPMGFSVHYRGDGCHWDVSAEQTPGRVSALLAAVPGAMTTGRDGGSERAFRIRGKPDAITIIDERWDPTRPHPREVKVVPSVEIAMALIVAELMKLPEIERVPE